MKAICPEDPEHKQFETTAELSELWLVDDTGSLIEVIEPGCVDEGPDPNNSWKCHECGAEAEVK